MPEPDCLGSCYPSCPSTVLHPYIFPCQRILSWPPYPKGRLLRGRLWQNTYYRVCITDECIVNIVQSDNHEYLSLSRVLSRDCTVSSIYHGVECKQYWLISKEYRVLSSAQKSEHCRDFCGECLCFGQRCLWTFYTVWLSHMGKNK